MLDVKETLCKVLPKNTTWHNEVTVHEKCILNNGTIYIDSLVQDKIRLFTSQVRTEWLGYLIGRLEGTIAYIDDIFIPLQRVSMTHVDVDEQILPENIIGTVHSHHDMGSFLSGTDHKYLVGNHPITIVASHTGLLAKMRVKAPCEALMLLDADIHVEDTKILKEFFDQNISKIQGNDINQNPPKLKWFGRIWNYYSPLPSSPANDNKKALIILGVIVGVVVLFAFVIRGLGWA